VLFLVDNSLSGNSIRNMPTQLTLDLVTKLPFSAVPRKQHMGHWRLDQKALQVDGVFNRGNPHPHYEGLFYKGKKTKELQAWWTGEMAERDTKRSNQYYLDNWEKKQKYREGRRLETRANSNANYAKKKAYYRAKNVRRRTENIKLTGFYKDALEEIHDLRMALDLAAVGAGEFPEGYNGQTRWSFELHHLSPLLEHKDIYCGLDAPWNVEILSIREHRAVHTRVSPSEC
jgi:hypothetical protein